MFGIEDLSEWRSVGRPEARGLFTRTAVVSGLAGYRCCPSCGDLVHLVPTSSVNLAPVNA